MPQAGTDRRLSLTELLDAFTNGHPDVLDTQLQSREDFERIRVDLIAALTRWRLEWHKPHATFALSIARIAIQQDWPNAFGFLSSARAIVLARPDPPGTKPDDDQFERTFHRAAVAFLAGVPLPEAAEAYLDSVADRVTTGQERRRPAPIDAPELVFARALARDTQMLSASTTASQAPRSWVVPVSDRARRQGLARVSALYEQASHSPDLAVEASVRRAFVQYRIGMPAPALGLLDAARPLSEPIVEYWSLLIRARVLVALGQPDAAIRTYEEALRLAPGAQTPAIALSALHLQMGRRDVAAALATRARTFPPAGEPWPQYWLGERRHLERLMQQLRNWP